MTIRRYIKTSTVRNILLLLFTVIALAACGPGGNKCVLDGHFLKMNQGQFFLYSLDGITDGIDTINVVGGHFEHEITCKEKGYVVLVFPNFSEMPIFIEPGKEISIKADATHIRDIEISGSDENKQMTKWRKETADMNDKQRTKAAEDFIKANPASLVSHWLMHRYFIASKDVDYKKAYTLYNIIKGASNETTTSTVALEKALKSASSTQVKSKLPKFTATDINGNKVSSADYMKGKAVILVWSSWNYDSHNIHRSLKDLNGKDGDGNDIKILSISLDPSKSEAKETYKRFNTDWPCICDAMMWDSPLVNTLGINTIPEVFILKDGVITDRNVRMDELTKKVRGY